MCNANVHRTYTPSEPVTVMGCAQQWKFCNPINNTCTPWGRKLEAEQNKLNLNSKQLAVLGRMHTATAKPALGPLVAMLGDYAVLAAAGNTGGSAGLPNDQWIRELDHCTSPNLILYKYTNGFRAIDILDGSPTLHC